jgi:hypothetical protein
MLDVSQAFPPGTTLAKLQRFAQAHGYRIVNNGRFRLYLIAA